MNTIIYISIAVVVLLIIMLINKLIRRRNQVQNIFGSVDAMLKKRYDLIPNLISSVQTYMKHEKTLLLDLTEMRTKAINPNINQDEKVEINRNLLTTIQCFQGFGRKNFTTCCYKL
ncbi:MAG: LemA family protein [Bacteroidota bacterium]|nr:LemA family protein [Bacteroidota bacterium]